MDKLRNAIRAEVLRTLAMARAQTRMGIVTGYDPDAYMATVNISPELVPTGWLPIDTAWAGSGFGLYFGLDIGVQVIVLHLEDDFESGMIIGVVNDDSHRPPGPVPSGEAHFVHKSGSLLKFTNDGDVSVTAAADMNLTAAGTVTIDAPQTNMTGNLTVEGNVSAGNGATGTYTSPTGQVVGVMNGITTDM